MMDARLLSALLLPAVAILIGLPVSTQAQSLYTDPTAKEPGDIVTVILDEQTSAQRESNYEGSSSSEVGASGSVTGSSVEGQFGADAEFESDTENNNESNQSDALTGTMTVRVVDVNQAGNLLVTGERDLTVNGVTHVMEVSGVVRTSDIRFNNTVVSHQIADAKVKYNQSGSRHNGTFSKGFFLKAGSAVLLGAGLFFGLK